MEKSPNPVTVEIPGINKYEMVLMVARRARQINNVRINLQKRFGIPLIEKDKPTNYSFAEVYSSSVIPTYAKETPKTNR
jgi:DNA-directed RNA polymerase subunit K/omega